MSEINIEVDDDAAVEIRPEVTMLSVLRHLNYEPWFAIAEFVDNSIQSFLTNEEALKKLHGAHFRLIVDITIDSSGLGKIIISDNAAGIAKADFPRAFRPAQAPNDRTGLSEFGMGMKSAACWFARTWSVRTKALGENVERTIRFDIDKIVEENIQTLSPEINSMVETAHYTTISLNDLHHPPKGRTVGKIKDHLGSIYRVFLRNGLLKIRFNDEDLSHELPKILYAIPYESVGMPKTGHDVIPVEWRKEINLDFGKGQRVTGFAALREKASTSMAGFALFRRERLIEGSHDDTYRPKQIFKHSTSYPYQRLFGELHIEGFAVSHTKDGFRWEEYEDEFLELLGEAIEDGELDLISQAENFRTLPTKHTVQSNAILATSVVAEHLESVVAPILIEARANPVLPPALPAQFPSNYLQSSERIVEFNDGGYLWIVTLCTSVDPAIENWISVGRMDSKNDEDGARTRRLVIDLALAHPFSMSYIGSSNENIELFLRIACGICIALVLAEDLTAEPPQTVLNFFNNLLRGALVRGIVK
jgi:hypothetical protein